MNRDFDEKYAFIQIECNVFFFVYIDTHLKFFCMYCRHGPAGNVDVMAEYSRGLT